MTTDLKPGQKVTLVRDFDPDVRASAPRDGMVLPVPDIEYTVRKAGSFEGTPIIWLEEIRNAPRFYLDVFGVAEQGFDASRFAVVAAGCASNVS
ncbi:MAG: hypothetical protein JZU55_00835 [Afipia sp.]|nr:hypothetical protein [Afipia sp.]